jgi:hypothetical protein
VLFKCDNYSRKSLLPFDLLGLPESLTKLFTGTYTKLSSYQEYTVDVYHFQDIKLYEEKLKIRIYLLSCLKGIFDDIKSSTTTTAPLIKAWATSTVKAVVVTNPTTTTTTTTPTTTITSTTTTPLLKTLVINLKKLLPEVTTSATTHSTTVKVTTLTTTSTSTTTTSKPTVVTTEIRFDDYSDSWKYEKSPEVIETTSLLSNTVDIDTTTSANDLTNWISELDNSNTTGILDDYSDFNNTVLWDRPVESENFSVPRLALAATFILLIVLFAVLITSTTVTFITSTISEVIRKQRKNKQRKQNEYSIFEDDWETRPIVKKARHKRSYSIASFPDIPRNNIERVALSLNEIEEEPCIILNSFKPTNPCIL